MKKPFIRSKAAQEFLAEFNYRFEERLALACGNSVPTASQTVIAFEDAKSGMLGLIAAGQFENFDILDLRDSGSTETQSVKIPHQRGEATLKAS